MKTASLRWIAAQMALFLLLLEAVVRVTRADWYALKPLLYFQKADIELFQESRDSGLIFQMRPGTKASLHGRTITVNSIGLRDPERSARKPKGVFRIICLGGSNTYGAFVNDGETYPAVLERLLNARSPGRFEVWNAGVNAYNLRQNVIQAEAMIERYDPDLLIFQYWNIGPRGFLHGWPFNQHFNRDPSLYAESLGFVPWGESTVGQALMRWWRGYRAAVIALNHFNFIARRYPFDGDRWNHRPFQRLYERHKAAVPMLLLYNPDSRVSRFLEDMEIEKIDLESLSVGMPEEYRVVHPPDHVYRWYAGMIMRFLDEGRLLP